METKEFGRYVMAERTEDGTVSIMQSGVPHTMPERSEFTKAWIQASAWAVQ